ncbi:MAG: PKD domain-containing protein [Candidatus Diapherotrites archaeon]
MKKIFLVSLIFISLISLVSAFTEPNYNGYTTEAFVEEAAYNEPNYNGYTTRFYITQMPVGVEPNYNGYTTSLGDYGEVTGAGNPITKVSVGSDKNSATPPATIVFDVNVDGGETPYTYTWTFGDANVTYISGGNKITMPHTFSGSGVYNVRVLVYDSAFQSSSGQKTVTLTFYGSSPNILKMLDLKVNPVTVKLRETISIKVLVKKLNVSNEDVTVSIITTDGQGNQLQVIPVYTSSAQISLNETKEFDFNYLVLPQLKENTTYYIKAVASSPGEALEQAGDNSLTTGFTVVKVKKLPPLAETQLFLLPLIAFIVLFFIRRQKK